MPEFIILVGAPGSGKTTYSNTIENALIAHRDDLKTVKKMFKFVVENLKDHPTVIFDATNPTIKARKEYIDWIKENFPDSRINVVFMTALFEEAKRRNELRPEPVPIIALRMFYKKLQVPTIDEGINEIKFVL